ncbi:MAG TPA: fused MFS/spermidine synthase [Alphaproteobacteria bacterium]|nr:fused MFS/spermidine synthase [Alphaproteobacteria bacterium]
MTNSAAASKPAANLALYLFSGTLFISAALMFAVQPMVGKMLLPLIGGTPAGWIVAMAFFQIMLLVGYFLAHALSMATPRRHGMLYILALLAGTFFLPLHLAGGLNEQLPISLEILRLLTLTVAVPFIALSATSSTIQRLFTETGHPSAHDPYFLYAASNLGSFAGLFAYPLVAEPELGLLAQTHLWQGVFMALIVLATGCLLIARGQGAAKTQKAESASAPAVEDNSKVTNKQRLNWILLAFVPSSLLSGVTTHISTDIFSAPMIWVLPLGAYLLTFVIAFSRKPLVSFDTANQLHPLVVPLVMGLLITNNLMMRLSWATMIFHVFAFSVVALLCHMLLAQSRPENSRKHLTEFYLMMSVGGALGGILNAFIIPYTLDRLIEYPLLMTLSLFINPAFRKPMTRYGHILVCTSLAMVVGYYIFIKTIAPAIYSSAVGIITPQIIMVDIAMALMFIVMSANIRSAIVGCAAIMFLTEVILPKHLLLIERNFFGVITIFERPIQIEGKKYTARYMYHGTTTHGTQIMEKPYNKTPTTYFTEIGPLGNTFMLYQPKKVAVIGLGVGTINCYSTPETEMTFVEIDQGVVDVAKSHFTFLDDCTGKTPPRIIVGDGRIEIEKLDEKFDMIIIDAFSSDTIPIHLLTTDALRSYLGKLNENGMLVMNISNRYFNLAPILAKNAAEIGIYSRTRLHHFEDVEANAEVSRKYPFASSSFWVAMAKNRDTLMPLREMEWVELAANEKLRPWTDDYTNPMRMLMQLYPVKMRGAEEKQGE